MSHFNYQNGRLHAESVPLTTIAEQFGTPAYVYSKTALLENLHAYQRPLADHPHLICYAVKANSNIAVLQLLARQGAGFDIVSVGELERVLAAGGNPEKVVFSGVGKLPHEITRALEAGIHCFNVESEAELELLNQLALSAGKTANVSLRVNPDVDANTHPYISTGLRENKFGIDINRALDVYRHAAAMEGIHVSGVDCHIGSQLTDTAPFLDALDRVLLLIEQLAEQQITLSHLDLGGGLGVCYKNEQPPATEEYLSLLLAKLNNHPIARNLTLILEPGRSIAANAGVLLTRVICLKKTELHNFAVVDAAMNDLLRPALYQAWMNIEPVIAPDDSITPELYDVVGPVCETGDFLGKQRQLAISQSDLLAVRGAGAYGFTMSSNYNSRGRAPEIIVDDDTCHLVRRRETIEDQMLAEALLPGEDA